MSKKSSNLHAASELEPVAMPATAEEPAETPQHGDPSGTLWEACSNLHSEGKIIARPGEEIFLSRVLSDHYLRSAPGSIKLAPIVAE